jgi:signal transduction histidine kinase
MLKRKADLRLKTLEAIILTEEKERKRIASDLHDGLGPVLSAVNLFFEAYIDAPMGTEKDNIETKLKVIINDAIADVSRISHNISPHILENYGLTTALKTFIDQLNNCEKIKIKLHIDHLNRFELKHELTIYRTITELINNTIKHANSNNIEIFFEQNGDLLKIKYKDDGSGFSNLKTSNKGNGMGIQNIQNRIESLGGNITFSNAENGGMKAAIEIPYKETARHETN